MRRTAFALMLAAATTLLHAADASSMQAMALKKLPHVTVWRHDIHQHPELSNREVRTTALVAAELKSIAEHSAVANGATVNEQIPRGVTKNHSPNFFLDEGALTIGMESMLQENLDYLNGPAT